LRPVCWLGSESATATATATAAVDVVCHRHRAPARPLPPHEPAGPVHAAAVPGSPPCGAAAAVKFISTAVPRAASASHELLPWESEVDSADARGAVGRRRSGRSTGGGRGGGPTCRGRRRLRCAGDTGTAQSPALWLRGRHAAASRDAEFVRYDPRCLPNASSPMP
jgi:hypothetical protein